MGTAMDAGTESIYGTDPDSGEGTSTASPPTKRQKPGPKPPTDQINLAYNAIYGENATLR